MRRHRAADLRLLAYHHALQDAGVGEAEGARDGGVAGGERDGAEGRGELVQVVADFVDGAVLGLQELAVFRKGVCRSWLASGVWVWSLGLCSRWLRKLTFLEEKPDLVAAGKKVVVTYVCVLAFAG